MAEPGVVMFTERPPSDWRRAALSLANACPGLTYGDAARACRYSQGFLDLVLTPVQLEAAAHALNTAGVPAAVLRIKDRVTVPAAFTLLKLGLDDLGLSGLEPTSTDVARVPWKRVHLIHLGWVRPATRPRALNQSLLGIEPLRREEARAVVGEPPELWLELVLREPFARLRIRMGSFDYDCLSERSARSEDNLREVLRLIAARAPGAIKAGLVDQSLEGEALDDSAALNDHENDRAVSWELTRRAARHLHLVPPLPSSETEDPVGLSRFRRALLIGLSVPLAVLARVLLLRSYPHLPARVIWPIQFAVWIPIVAALALLYVGVQMRADTLKERRK